MGHRKKWAICLRSPSGVEEKKCVTPPSRNPKTSCSNDNISQTTGRILFKMIPLESRHRELSCGNIYTEIRPVV